MINKNIIFAEETIIAHGCNCQGKMNSGVAKAIRNRWPSAYTAYLEQYKLGKLVLGSVNLVQVPASQPKYVANCLTQLYYGYDAKPYASISAIQKCLEEVAQFASSHKYSVALPPIGCGLGGLSWTDVGPMIEKIFTNRGVSYNVYDYRAENWKS
jgi:O-acetyl-ADP-ribose deacetylase (regulator of RNase III)